MARQRMIKPEFWSDERVSACAIGARLLFIASWNHADDEGNLARSARQLKAQAFPYDDVDCEPWLLELLAQGLLAEYQVAGKSYLNIPNFKRHQTINRPSRPQCPPPAGSVSHHPETSKEVKEEKQIKEIQEAPDNQQRHSADETCADSAGRHQRAGLPARMVFPEVQNRQLVEDWLRVRRDKKLAVAKTALEGFRREVEKSGRTLEFILRLCCEKSWGGFEARFLENLKLPPHVETGGAFDMDAFCISVGA